MTPLDWIFLAFPLLMAVWGYAQGLLVGALSLGGFAAGAFGGSRLGPMLLNEGSASPWAPLVALGAAVLTEPGDQPWWVLADPEGHEFCAFPPEAVATNDEDAEVAV